MKRLLPILFILFTISVTGQELYPVLTKKLGGVSDSTAITKIERIYRQELAIHPKNVLLLKLWKYSLYDSLGFTVLVDSICTDLLPDASNIPHKKSASIYVYMGNKEFNANQYEKGISLFHKGLLIAKKYKDVANISMILKEIGVAYRKLDDLKNAEKYLREALFYAYKSKDDLQIGNVYLALGNALREKKDLKNSTICFEKSLAIGKRINNARLLAGNYNNLGLIEDSKKQYANALTYYKKAVQINAESGNKLWESFNYLNIGNTYDNMKNPHMALKYYQQSTDLKLELGDSLMLLSSYLNLGDAYYDIKEYKNAYDNLILYVKLKERLNIKEQTDLLNDLEAKYESDKKQAQIEQLKMGAELQQVKNDSLKMQNEKNRNISILSILVAISLSVGLGILWKTNKRRKQINGLLNVKNNEIELTNHSLQDALSKLSIKNKEVIDSINYATYIQQATLPNISQLSSDLLRLELFFAPKDIVSGDFYFSYQMYQKSIFGVADCTGHGVPGAMVSLIGMNSLDKVVRDENHDTSASMIESLNKHVKESLQRGGESINDGMDISFCYLNHEDNILHFTGANHAAYIIRKTDSVDYTTEDENISMRVVENDFSIIQLSGIRRPIGKSISEDPFFEVKFKVNTNDRIVLLSDGFADQIGGDFKKKLKKGELLSLLLKSTNKPVKDQIIFMKEQFETWKGDMEQVDDVCLLVVEVV